MPKYEYGRIQVLADRLEKFGVAPDVAARILEGGEDIRKTTTPEKKAEWFKLAMDRMDALLDRETRQAVREACACCLSGKRREISKDIAENHATLEERIAAANEARYVFGRGVTLQDDGRILVYFEDDGKTSYRCVCMPKAKEPFSPTYCYCCGGHIKHHLQTALGVKLSCEVRSTALTSGGKTPCSFIYTIKE